MKFISKQSNYRIVLRYGQSPEPISGRLAVPGLYVKFEDGLANVEKKELCEMMLKHPAYKKDFILNEENAIDPWGDFRKESEPEHNITNLEYGHVGKSVNPKARIPLNRDGQKVLKEMATEMAKEMLKTMLKEKQNEKNKEEELKTPEKETPITDEVVNPTTPMEENKEVDKTNDNKID